MKTGTGIDFLSDDTQCEQQENKDFVIFEGKFLS